MKLLALFAMAALALGCENASRALEPVWGKQPCAHCAMLLSEPRFGAQLTTEAGERFYFDDPGCMAAFEHDRHPRVHAAWVHDAHGWIDARSARFERAASPMDYGFAPSAGGAADWQAVERAARARGERR